MRKFLLLVFLGGAAAFFQGCAPSGLSEEEKRVIAQLRLSQLGPLPPDPGNAVADDPRAAALGEALFFDARLSGDGTVSCATCHLPDRQFQDDIPLARGIGVTDRRTMPLASVAHSPWQFWDGRKDSLWSQALAPLEDAREHGGDRTSYAQFIAAFYKAEYEAIFGPLPEFSAAQTPASPLGSADEQAAWSRMSDDDRVTVDTAFSNIGKAIAAFERTILHAETRFDRFAEAVSRGQVPQGDAVFNSLEMEGLRLFIGKANCIDCHNGPRFSDSFFHNTGVPAVSGLPDDHGRAQAVQQVLADPFNCLGPYGDPSDGSCEELRFMVRESPEFERAFKTPSLRGAASRPPYMHSGQIGTLDAVIDHYSRAPDAPSGRSELRGVTFTDRGRAALIAFLTTLE